MVAMIERLSHEAPKDVPTGAPELSASEMADVIRASARERDRVEIGPVDPRALRDALERARQTPVEI